MKIGSVELNCEQLERLEDERVFMVRIVEGGVRLTECCDQCFGVDLNALELYRLSQELSEIAFNIDPRNAKLIEIREAIKRGEEVLFLPKKNHPTGLLQLIKK